MTKGHDSGFVEVLSGVLVEYAETLVDAILPVGVYSDFESFEETGANTREQDNREDEENCEDQTMAVNKQSPAFREL